MYVYVICIYMLYVICMYMLYVCICYTYVYVYIYLYNIYIYQFDTSDQRVQQGYILPIAMVTTGTYIKCIPFPWLHQGFFKIYLIAMVTSQSIQTLWIYTIDNLAVFIVTLKPFTCGIE